MTTTEELVCVVLTIEAAVELVTMDEETGRDDVNRVVAEVRIVKAMLVLDAADEDTADEDTVDEDTADEAATEEETAKVEVETTLVARLVDPVATVETAIERVAELATCDVLAATDDVARLVD